MKIQVKMVPSLTANIGVETTCDDGLFAGMGIQSSAMLHQLAGAGVDITGRIPGYGIAQLTRNDDFFVLTPVAMIRIESAPTAWPSRPLTPSVS